MSIVKELCSAIEYAENTRENWTSLYKAKRLIFDDILKGKYGTEIMLDYLDLLGGDSVAFVAKYAGKELNLTVKAEVQLDLFE